MTFFLPQEHTLWLEIVGVTSVGLVCTDEALQELIVGYLYNEQLISCVHDIEEFVMESDRRKASVWLRGSSAAPEHQIRPSGLGGHNLCASTDLPEKLLRSRYSIAYIRSCAKHMDTQAVKYAQTGGMQCSALFNSNNMLSMFEDVGRHNTLDKISGDCLLNQIPTEDTLLITSGRISSDMVRKAAGIGASVIASFSVPTQKAFDIAKEANMTLIGYLNKSKAIIYTATERIL